MSKAQWGRIVAAIAAIVIVLLVVLHLVAGHGKPSETASERATPGPTPGVPPSSASASASGSVSSGSVSSGSVSSGSVSSASVSSASVSSASVSSASVSSSSAPGSVSRGHASVGATRSSGTEASVKNSRAPTAATASAAAVQKEAEAYVQHLTQSSSQPLEVTHAEGFVTADRALAVGPASAPKTAGTPPKAVGTATATEAGQVAAPETAAALNARQARSPEVATAGSVSPKRAESAQAGTVAELKSEETTTAGGAPSATTAESASQSAKQVTVDLPVNEQVPVTIADIIGPGADVPPDAVYYVHTVQSADSQGIWGIIETGVIDNFAEGVAVRRGGTSNTYRVHIPPDADQLRADHSSSFLGELIYEKSRASYVYDYKTGRIGKNPNLIKPGQEIVIVSFTPKELIEIYKHFVYLRGKGSGTAHS